ncbi:GntR family transcriptional regulator [uncultured Microbacterium sp.]|uniref:GntR family transcriptional regulator n=1 Tax=uncultured Microbacterium sp. TaxID=191216 RepID=UPI0026390213|nr:GntR family transcriptional regulator [uncultured Microbacterium sp.]
MVSIRPTRAPALGDQLAAVLRDQIVRRQLEPGTHLVEDALAAEYDVSRGPVRDALRQLEGQGLVESRRRGFFVVGLSHSDIHDLYELRESIEIVAATRAVSQIDDEHMRAGRAIVDAMVDAADRSDAAAFAAADMRFHALLYEISGNRRLTDVWESYAPVFASLMQLTVEEDVDLHPSAHDHGRLLDVIAEGDVTRLQEELREHLDGARGRMAHAVDALNATTSETKAS